MARPLSTPPTRSTPASFMGMCQRTRSWTARPVRTAAVRRELSIDRRTNWSRRPPLLRHTTAGSHEPLAIKKKYVRGDLALKCDTIQDWIEALSMDAPIQVPAALKIAVLEAEVRDLRRIAVEAGLRLGRREARRANRSRGRAGRTARAKRLSRPPDSGRSPRVPVSVRSRRLLLSRFRAVPAGRCRRQP